jgi:ribonuclease HI
VKRFESQPDIREAEAEAKGVLEGLIWLKGMNRSNVYLETDCLRVVQHIRNKIHDKYQSMVF